jgi:hypothetical protein
MVPHAVSLFVVCRRMSRILGSTSAIKISGCDWRFGLHAKLTEDLVASFAGRFAFETSTALSLSTDRAMPSPPDTHPCTHT